MKNISKFLLGAVFLFGLGSLIAWGAGLIFIDDSGNFGIGNTTPLHKLDVSGSLYSRMVTLTDSSATTVNWNSGNVQTLPLSIASTTLTFSNAQAGGEYKLVVKQDSTGGRSLTWPSGIKWEGTTAPTMTSTTNAIDVVDFVYDGTNYIGSYSLNHKSAPVTVFSDDFNRTDSSTVGNSWSEGVYTTWANEQGQVIRNAIVGNKLRQKTVDSYGGGIVSKTYSGATSDIKIVGNLTLASSWGTGNAALFLRAATNSYFQGWGMVISSNGGVSIRDGASNLVSTSFALTAGHTYNFEIGINPNNHMDVYLWDAAGSKPGSPTVSWTNGGSAYTVNSSGDFAIESAPDDMNSYVDWDSIEVTQY